MRADLDMSLKQAETEVRNEIYKTAMVLIERLESRGLINGNGHHIAQAIAENAVGRLYARWKKE